MARHLPLLSIYAAALIACSPEDPGSSPAVSSVPSAAASATAPAAASAPPTGAASAPAPAAQASSQPAANLPAPPKGSFRFGDGIAGFADGSRKGTGPWTGPPRFNKPIRLSPSVLQPATEAKRGDLKGLLVADISNHSVRHLELSDDGLTVRTAMGEPSAKGHADGEGAAVRLNAPHGVASAPRGAYIAEASNHTLRWATPLPAKAGDRQGWSVETVAGAPGVSGFVDGAAAEARFSSPHGICLLPDGGLIVADIGNKRLRLLKEGQVTTVAGGDEAGAKDGVLGVGNLTAPIDVTCLKDGSVLIADAGSMSIRRWRSKEGLTTVPTDRPLNVPHSVTVDAEGRILVAELGGHVVTDITGGKAKVVFGTGEAGPAFAQLNRPADVLVHAGLLWIADLGNHQIKAVPWPPKG